MVRRVAGCALVVFLFAVSARGGALTRKLDEALQRQSGGGFWGVALVARGGEVLLAKGYGYADYATRPNTPDTLFEIASLSKQFTAAAILRLEEAGKLALTDPVSKFFPRTPPDKKGILVLHLLNHTAGISPRIGVPYASSIGRAEYLRKMLAEPLVGKPGERFRYANVGYALLAAIVEVASGQSFEACLEKEVFRRAGLKSTGFIGDRALIESGRDSVRLMPGAPPYTAARWHWGWGYRGMGGVVTTANDLLRWDRALRSGKVLSAKSLKKLYDPAPRGYALGWFVETTERGTRKVHHGGGVAGFACQLDRYLEEDAVVLLLSNGRQNVRALSKVLGDVLFPPPNVVLEIDATPYPLNRHRAAHPPPPLGLDVEKAGNAVSLAVKSGEHVFARVRLPLGPGKRVLLDLDRAIRIREKDGPRAGPPLEATVFLAAYPGKASLRLEKGAGLSILSEYRGRGEDGRPVVDERVVLVFSDRDRGAWPVMVKLSLAAAKSLRADLTGALE